MHRIVHELREQSTWRLLGLEIITLGLYGAFYIRRQTHRLNRHLPADEQIWPALPHGLIVLNVIGIAVFAGSLLTELSETIELASSVIDMLHFVGYLLWAFAARSHMNRLLHALPGDVTWFHGLWTFLFTNLYFNYKINVLAESGPPTSDDAEIDLSSDSM